MNPIEPDRRVGAVLRHPLAILLLACVLCFEFAAWRSTEGYQLADSVEFMERARSLERGQAMVDSLAIRPFGFSTVLLPFFAVADWLGLPDQRAVAWTISLFQIALGLALVAVAMRLGGRIAGQRGALLAGTLTGANPVLLQYSSQPVSGLAAGICAGLAVDAILTEDRFRSGVRCGAWLGIAFLMAFQSLLVATALLLVLLLRDVRRRRALLPPSVRGLLCGFGAALLVQILIDWALFGTPGASLYNYAVQNFGAVAASFLARIGWRAPAVRIYELTMRLQGREGSAVADSVLAAKQSPWFYIAELPRMLVWPAIAALVLGFVRTVRRPDWRVALPALVFAVNVLAMSNKGSKDFRLWLPLLPLIALVCVHGWTWLAPRTFRAGILLDLGFSLAVLGLGAAALAPLGSRRFAGYWRAMDWANLRAGELARESAHPRVAVASAYNWAVYLRDSPDVDLRKLPWQVDLWPRYSSRQRAEILAALEEIELFLVHLAVLRGNPELLEFLAARFAVAAAVHDQVIDLQGLGPILVLERRRGALEENLLFETGGTAPSGPPAMRFSREDESLDLLDWSYRRLPPQGLGWITYRWRSPGGLSRDYTFLDRITSLDEGRAWQNDHAPAWGRRPANAWPRGEVLTEGYLVVPAQDPYRPGGPFLPLGGEDRARTEVPADLWMAIVDLDPAAREEHRFVVRTRLEVEPSGSAPEPRTSADGFAHVASFLLPIPENARL